MPRLFGVCAVLVTVFALGGPPLRAQQTRQTALQLAIERALTAAPANLQWLQAPDQAGVRVRNALTTRAVAPLPPRA